MILHNLDTVIGFFAIILAASLVIAAGTQLIASLLGLRGANLRRSLADLFETACDDRDAKRYSKVIARRVLQQPLVSDSIFARFGLRLDDVPYLPADAAGKLRWAGSEIPLQPWLFGALTGLFLAPLSLFALNRLFPLDFCASTEAFTRYVPFLNLCDHPWRTGAILGAILGGLLSRWRLATSIRLDELVAILDKLSAPVGGTLPDPAQRAMLVIAGETRSRARGKSNPVPSQIERIFREAVDEGEGGVAVAVEKPVTAMHVAAAAPAETKAEGLNLWFEHAMDRASQRFTVQARAITVVLSVALVLAAHFDAIRLFQSLSSDTPARAQLAGSADVLMKQAEQLSRGKEGGRTVVPDVYRSAMVNVLEMAPPPEEQIAKSSKSRRSSHSSVPPADAAQAIPGAEPAPNEVQISASGAQPGEEGAQAVPAVAQPAPEASPKKNKSSKRSKAATVAVKEHEKLPAPGEDRVTLEAKNQAFKALAAHPGFASREDAVVWLRDTLGGDPATENLTAAYEREVNVQLPGDADKLIDETASIKAELARSEVRLIPEKWTGWEPSGREWPGLLVGIILISIGASLCFNLLKSLASLRPLPKLK